MRNILVGIVGGVLLAAGPAQAGPRMSPEAQLERALEGRVAGEPVECISLRQIRSSRIIDDTAIVYEIGNTLYVNRPRAGAESLNSWDVLVTRTHGSQLCSVDSVTLFDNAARMQTGFVLLGDFVPYRRR